ncbi:RNase A-like domain-containing protein [Xanthomonas arboricola]|uniref:RNase A-like domain-containing protein n=1 Tax=Xanthomonas arboricola TaxID=56448 RepID=UPI003D1617B0
MGAGSLRSQIGAVGDVSTVKPFSNLNEPGPSSQLVEGGGLQAHENAGGHLLLKHVGQSEQALLTRLIDEPRIPGSSSFYDRSTAELAVFQALDANQAGISSWLGTAKPQLVVTHNSPFNVGITVRRTTLQAMDTSGMKLVIRRDSSMPMGYRVHTGYPE